MSFRAGFLRARLSNGRVIVRDTSNTRLFARFNSQVVSVAVENRREQSAPKSRLQRYVDTLINATGQVDVINQYYPALSWEASQIGSASNSTPSPSLSPLNSSPSLRPTSSLSEEHVEKMLETLAASGRPIDLQRIEEILADMSDIFGMVPTAETHTAIIRGLLLRRNMLTILLWFKNMPLKPGGVSPTLEHYHMFLEAAPEFTSFKGMRNIISDMRKDGCSPTNETYKILLRAWWKLSPSPPPPSHIAQARIFEEMREQGLGYDPSIPDFLSSAYVAQGLDRWASDITDSYNVIFSSHLSPQEVLENKWIPRLSHVLVNDGFRAALDLYAEYVKEGGCASSRIFDTLLRYCTTRDRLHRIAKVLGMQPGRPQWSMLIMEICRQGLMDEAFEVYEESKAAGIAPDATMIAPLIRGLFHHAGSPPPDSVVDTAIELYNDFKHASAALNLSTDGGRSAFSPGTDIYHTLIRNLTKSQNRQKYSPFMKTLLNDLLSQGIDIHGVAASITTIRMRLAGDEKEAFKEYQRGRLNLDRSGYESVLDAFCRISLQGNLSVPSLSLYFNIVKDMKKAGHGITVTVYNIILRHFGQIGTKAKTDPNYIHLMGKLVGVTRRVHDLITLDASIEPDAMLWNHLMDTYQRLGCFADAWRVWDQMSISGRFDHVSVSIILDACGHAGATHLAQQVIQRLKMDGYKLNLHNYNAWIECLCRLNNLNQALKVLCLEMVDDVLPDLDSVRIVRSFAKRPDIEVEILMRIRQYQPKLYVSLPDVQLEGLIS
ncbi:pentatricopeptide repeat-containing protein (UP7) [Moniliophthora roreri]|uniref:Putative conserved protein UP7 n=1 Tax=Moniliophthora roreri TaxID=221103 RepID=A0A0W0FAQ1_MONRR|nr:pentatricopeptide repeat-containing protein (UP7) [Moniliophthora roreri]